MPSVQDILNQFIEPTAPVPDLNVNENALNIRDIELANNRLSFPDPARSDAQIVADTALSTGMGALNSVLGIGAMGLGIHSPYAGNKANQFIKAVNEGVDPLYSSQLRNSRARYSERVGALSEETKNQFDKDKKNDGIVAASLKRVGRDIINSTSEVASDGVMAGDVVSQGVGSLLAAGPLSSGLRKLGAATIGKLGSGRAAAAASQGRYLSNADRIAIAAAEGGPTAAAIGLMEGGGAYTSAAQDAYDRMEGVPEDERIERANKAGLLAAAIQAPIGVATGSLVAKFEGNPLKVGSVTSALKNIGKETIEEATQSASGRTAQNIGVREFADPNLELSEGVGEEIALGAIGGAGSAGVVQAPGTALRGSLKAAKLVGGTTMRGARAGLQVASGVTRPIYEGLLQRGDRILKEAEKQSPVREEVITETYQAAAQEAPVAEQAMREVISEVNAPEELKVEGNEFVDKLMSTFKFDPTELDTDDSIPEVVKEQYRGSVDRLDAINRTADIINKAGDTDDTTQLVFGLMLHNLMEPINDLKLSDPKILDQVPKNHPVNTMLDDYRTVAASLQNSPKIASAQRALNARISLMAEQGELNPVSDAELDTTEGQAMVQATIVAAQLEPEKTNPEAIKQILAHAASGKVFLSANQEASLKAATALVQMQQEYDAATEKLGLRPLQIVSREIQNDNKATKVFDYSAKQHMERVLLAKRAGDNDLAASALNRLALFGEHMLNKLTSLNEAMASGDFDGRTAISYKALNPKSLKWFDQTFYLNAYAKGGVEFAQRIAVDTEAVITFTNRLIDLFPELNVAHLKPVSLDPSLATGSAEEVAASFRGKGKDKAKVPENEVSREETQPQEAEQVVEQDEVIPEPEVAEAPVEAPVEPELTSESTQTEEVLAEAPEPVFGTLKSDMLKKTYRLPNEPKTRIVATENPISVIKDAIRSSRTLSNFIGSNLSIDNDIAQAYQSYLNKATKLIGSMNTSLDAFLNKRKNLEFDRLISFSNGKALAITEEIDGKVQYNSSLQEAAVLAGLQWFLNYKNYQARLDAGDVAAITDIPEELVSTDLIQQFNAGLTLISAKRSLAQKIESYLGMSGIPNAPLNQSEGIPEALASEVLKAMLDNGMFKIEPIRVSSDQGLEDGEFKDINIYIPNEEVSAVNKSPELIEKMVMIEPEETLFIGSPPTKIAKTQMRNRYVELTDKQTKAIAFEQKQPFYVDAPMANFYRSLGLNNVLTIFGNGVLGSEENYNINHYKSLEGQNRTIISAYNSLMNLIDQAGEQAIYYDYNFSRVNRMQMLGKDNPQASKLVREAVLPTWSTVDLGDRNSDSFKMFGLAIAQALGIKVHTISLEQSYEEVFKLLDGDLAPVVAELQRWLENQTDTIDESILQGHGLDFMGMHAVLEYARYLNAENKDGFRTSLYVEADGVTNGPVNAMALMTPGRFTSEFLSNIGKGGLFFGSKKTMNEHRENDKVDLYETVSGNLITKFIELRNENAGPVSNQINSLMKLLSTFNKDVIYDSDKGTVTFKRGIAKNPLTITLYGSGARGIAGNLVQIITEGVYQKMSELINDKDTDTSFTENLIPLLNNVVKENKGVLSLQNVANVNMNIDARKFKFKKEQIDNLTQNMLHLFVNPLREAISDTVGPELMGTLTTLRQATQVQSIFLEYTFKREVARALENKTDGSFLSRNELDEIIKSLSHLNPFIETGDMSFFVAGSSNVDLPVSHFGTDYADKLRTPAFVEGPKDSGVAGIPFMVIGSGDGQMMLNLSNAGVEGLKIFDGMNLALDKVLSGSEKANEAVYESWMKNPLKNVADSYKNFMRDLSFKDMSDEQKKALVRGLLEPKLWNKDVSIEQIFSAMKSLETQLTAAVSSIEARHQVMDEVQVSIDQMAAAGAPFVNEGSVNLDGLSEEQVLNELNSRYRAKHSKLAKRVSENISEELNSVGRPTSSGARELSFTAIRNLVRKLNVPDEQKQIYQDIIRSLATKEYKVIFGSYDQVNTYASERGLYIDDSGSDTKGLTVAGENTIYLYNPSSETLLHELVHAATFDQVYNYYNGGNVSVEEAKAIERIYELLDQFMRLDDDFVEVGPDLRNAYAATKETISSYLRTGNKAAAVNEFMAWNLSNQALIRLQKRTPSLVQLAKDVIEGIKRLVFGRKKVTEPMEDMFTNLRFNTNILLRSQPTVQQETKETVLYQSYSYGNNSRLVAVNEAFDKRIADYVDANITDDGRLDPNGLYDVRGEATKAIAIAQRVARSFNSHGFAMTMQEKTTFESIVAALATEAEIDPNALVRAQELYSHVTQNLKVENFMNPNASDEDVERAYAQEKYDSVMGNFLSVKDDKNRSTLLSAFLGLAIVDDGFREILKTIPVPKSQKNPNDSLDNILENVGNSVMDSLSARMAGDKKSKNVQASIDALARQIVQTAQDRKTFLDQMVTPVGNGIDAMNNTLLRIMEKVSDIGVEKGKELSEKDNKALKIVGTYIQAMSSILTEKNGEKLSEGVLSAIDRVEGFKPLTDLLNDMVGRTESNSSVYDMIKAVRSMVAQLRQQYREHLPTIIADKFSRKLSDQEWTDLFDGMGKTDLAGLRSGYSMEEILGMLRDESVIETNINDLEARAVESFGKLFPLVQKKAKQLAHFMNTGTPGNSLLRNAYAVANLSGQRTANDQEINMIDQLVSLYAVQALSEPTKKSLSSLAQKEAEGMSFTLSYLVGQRAEETRKAGTGPARSNQYKGYLPTQNAEGLSLLIANDTDDHDRLINMSFERIAEYKGSNLDRDKGSRGYYFAPVKGQAMYNQGIMQNVRPTAGGVDLVSGFTFGMMTAGRITDPDTVNRITRQLSRERATEPLLPVFDEGWQIVAYERSVAPEQLKKLERDTHLAKMIGVWRGRQIEELQSDKVNEVLIDNLYDMYQSDLKEAADNQERYINILDPKELKKDKVLSDAVSLISPSAIDYARSKFGDVFWVRRTMLNDAIGYRQASVGDLWTGTSRWSPETRQKVLQLAANIFGRNTYKYLMNAESFVQNFVTDARVLIVIKSVVVPATNLLANIYQMVGRGVPMLDIVRGMPKKTAEVQSYVKTRVRALEIEAELLATDDIREKRKLEAELQSIKDAHTRLSIWPLIEAGEFSSISDAGISRDEILLAEGKINDYFEKLVSKLPPGIQTAGRYALITKDTALFQGLQRAVEYGDFLAKAIVYDDLTKRQGRSSEQALGRVTEEFVNYDRLSGRNRGYLESVGLLWFWHFKIRSTKIALSMLRNNPVHSMLAMAAPTPVMFGSVGLPINDNLLAVLADGRLDYSMGPAQGFRSFALNPWMNLTH